MAEGVLRATAVTEHVADEWATPVRPIRALLIQPPTEGCVQSLLPQVAEKGEGIGYKPPLGILYVASTVADRTPHEVQVIDAIAERLGFDELVERARAFQPDVVGISAWTDWWWPAYETGRRIKEALPQVHLTYGGPHLGVYPQETLEVPFVDSVIVGDGEMPFLYLCNMVANGSPSNALPGLHLSGHGVKTCNDTFFIQEDLDALPIPNRNLLKKELYGSVLSQAGSGELVTTMITSRGCPYKCTFCKLNFQKTLSRSAASVIEEFRQIQALGISEVEIYDDTFTWSKKRLEDICRGLIAEGIDVKWAVRDRVKNARAELLELMYAAGCRRIHFGVESGSDPVLERMRKGITSRDARRAIELAKDAGMTVLAYFMFGNLGETLEDMRRTIDFAVELDPHYAQFSITIPYAGTEMYKEGLACGRIKSDYWGEYARNPVRDMKPRILEEVADLETLVKIRNDAVRAFYFRPRYLWREARRLTSVREVLNKARMGGQLVQSVYTK